MFEEEEISGDRAGIYVFIGLLHTLIAVMLSIDDYPRPMTKVKDGEYL